MKIFFRKLHRWLGLLMVVQIVAWMASGLYFSIFPIEEIRGEHLTRSSEPLKAEGLSQMGSPAQVKRELDRHFGPGWELTSLSLFSKGARVVWRIDGKVDGFIPELTVRLNQLTHVLQEIEEIAHRLQQAV